MNICIYGSGLIGLSLAERFSEMNHSVVVLTKRINDNFNKNSKIKFIQFNTDFCFENFEDTNILFVCGGRIDDFSNNYQFELISLAKATTKSKIFRVIFISTVAVYGEAISGILRSSNEIVSTNLCPKPLLPYSVLRFKCEDLLFNFFNYSSVEFAVVRIPMVISKDMNVSIFKSLHHVLKFGFFPYFGTITSSLPCIRIQVLVDKLILLSSLGTLDKPIYQFSEKLTWIKIFQSYGRMSNKHVVIFFLSNLLPILDFILPNKLKYIFNVLSNEVTYQDDFHEVNIFEPLISRANYHKIDDCDETSAILWNFLNKN